jgi:hypothetical protein
MSATFTAVITREIEIEVEYEYSKATRGARDSFGAPEEPDEPESVEIIGATSDGKPFELTDEETKAMEAEALDDVAAQYEAAQEAKYDAWRDR